MTRGYQGLKKVTTGLKRVTKGFRELQEVKERHKGLQGVTRE